MTKPIGIILAGGQARRMGGGDKGRLMLGGRSLLDHVMDRLSCQVDTLALNANGDPDRFADIGVPVIADSIPEFVGPLAGVLAGMDYAQSQGADHIVTVAADTPFFPTDFVARLWDMGQDMRDPLVLAATVDDGRLYRHPTFGLWPVSLRDDLRAALHDGLRKVVLWTDQHGGRSVEFDISPFDPFFNVNTPQDLEQAARIIGDFS